MKPTLEQLRAQDAWNKAEEGISRFGKDYVNAAKGLPALIMNSGLMQVLAYCHDKNGANELLASHLRQWLSRHFNGVDTDPGFKVMMEALMKASPAEYQAITTEAFAWLRWMRQMAAAKKGAE